MQVWDQVKVANADSEHAGRAGCVVRTEKKGDRSLVEVRLDADDAQSLPVAVVPFDESELQFLGR